MSIISVHGPNTFGSKAVTEVGPAMATVNPTNGLIWTFKTDQPSTRTASLVWTFPTGTPSTITGPGPTTVTFASAGTKAVTMVATGAGEGANPYPVAGTTNLPVTAISGSGQPGASLLSAPGDEESPDEEDPDIEVAFDPAAHTVTEVIGFVEDYPDTLEDVIDAEEAGKARSTLLQHLESMRSS
jgi:hypothetical protein